ncbi:MAG: hypothetical protein HN348_16440 [Proteobacteria bacterium]|nr:hypothetical protein [Pseudomonadota bacterium]
MKFCNSFDERLARKGPAAVFLLDRDGLLRFDARWTRDAWERAPGPHQIDWRWLLLRDHATGFVLMALSTGKSLIEHHPRLDVRSFDTYELASKEQEAFGSPPICESLW